MKKIRSLILILLLPLCFSECTESQSEDQLLQNNEELTVNEAKEFISSQCIDQFSLKSGSLEDKAIKIKADWGRVKSSSNNKVSLVEADILTLGGKFSFATKQNFEAYQKTKQIDFVSSPTRLIVKKNKKTRETVAFFMTIVGDQNYLLENACEISNNSYLNIDKKFIGVVLFHNLQGDFVNGWKYSNGKISHTVSMNQNLNIDTKLKSTANCICETTSYFYTTWEDRYQTVHSEGIEPVTSYSHSRAITIEIVVENCTYSGPSGDGVDYSDSPASDPYNYLPEPTANADCILANSIGISCEVLMAFELDYKSRMADTEKQIFNNMTRIQQLNYLANAQNATWQAETLYPNSLYNGIGDAYRHAYWNAMNVITLGYDLSFRLATAHEENLGSYPYAYKETEMDLFNNNIGRERANYFSNGFSSIEQSIQDAINTGALRYLSNLAPNGTATSDSQLIPTNQ